jgi:hypothetical protein
MAPCSHLQRTIVGTRFGTVLCCVVRGARVTHSGLWAQAVTSAASTSCTMPRSARVSEVRTGLRLAMFCRFSAREGRS